MQISDFFVFILPNFSLSLNLELISKTFDLDEFNFNLFASIQRWRFSHSVFTSSCRVFFADSFREQTLLRPRIGMLETMDQGHNTEVISKKRSSLEYFVSFPEYSSALQKRKSSKIFSQALRRSPKQNWS